VYNDVLQTVGELKCCSALKAALCVTLRTYVGAIGKMTTTNFPLFGKGKGKVFPSTGLGGP
jgi:hypothetical protein